MGMLLDLPEIPCGSATARQDIIHSRDRVEAVLRQQDMHAELLQNEMMPQHHLEAAASIGQALRPFNVIPKVEEWKLQYYAPENASATRFKLLVLEGDSRFGKTRYACSLFGQRCTYVCNCQGVKQPYLSRYDRRVHKAIVGSAAEGESEAAADSQEEPVPQHRRSGGRPLHAQAQDGCGSGGVETEAA